ncbi:VCBS repeat-containing protein [Streptomyces sp. NPDC052676]|uniref:VCBS repeat-containing protein n=1 Tax=Streptomyces sp. NPDC052676 TaxID=3154953 RepID=UPI00342322D4
MLTLAVALVAACSDGRGDPPPRPTAGPAIATCVTASGGLVADFDGDGTADRASKADLTGAGLTLTFGAKDGARDAAGTTVRPRDLVGDRGEDAKDVLAVVADFDRDGWVDLFVAATGEFRGDDPIEPDVSELRFGPFSSRGRGQSDRHVDLNEPRAVAVADHDGDRYPDLAAYRHQGDGVYATEARLGGEHGLDRKLDAGNRRYVVVAEETDNPTPSAMPHTDLTGFHPTCAVIGSK